MNRQLAAGFGEALAGQRLGVLLTAQGQLEEGLSVLQAGVAAAERSKMRSHALTRLYAAMAHNRLLAGDLAAAGQALTVGLSTSRDHGHCGTCESLLLPVAVSIRIAQGDLAAAEAFCDQLDDAAARYRSRTWLALAHRARGELAAARGDAQAAAERYQEALAHFEAAGNAYEVGRSQKALARLQG